MLLLISLSLSPAKAYGWGNGRSNSTGYPYYGIHDVVADVAYQKLRDYNATTASWIAEYYLNLSGSKWGDYQYSFGRGADNWLSYTDDPDAYYKDWENHLYEVHGTQRGAPERVKQCYDWIVANLTMWILYGRAPRPVPADAYSNAPLMSAASEYAHKAAYAAGLLTHYFSDLSQFGHTDYTEKDHAHPASYDPANSTYHDYYESNSIGDNFLYETLKELGSYSFKVDKRVSDVESLTENFARWINAHDNSSALYVEADGKPVIVGSTFRQLLTDYVSNYDAGVEYLSARGYSPSLYSSTILHVSAAVGNVTQLLYSAYIDAEEKAATATRVKASTQINLELASSSLRVGEPLSLTMALATENKSRIEGQTLYLSIVDNSTSAKYPNVLGSVLTDISGGSGWKYTENLNVGAYKIVAWFLGNETYASSYSSKTFTVRLYATSLSLTLSPATQGKTTTLKATLKDEDGRPVKGASVDFYIANTISGSAETNSDGIATLSLTPSEAGTFQVRVRYTGGNMYSRSDSEPATLEVHIDYTMYAVVGSLTAVALIAILFIKRRF